MPEPEKLDSQAPFYNVMPETTSGKNIMPRKVNATKADGIFGRAPVKASSNTTFVDATGGAPKTAANSASNATPQPTTATNITLNKPKRSFLSRKVVLVPLVIILLGLISVPAWMIYQSKYKVASDVPEETTPIEQVGDPDVTTPGEWLSRFFGSDTCVNKNQCADASDPDHDGFSNKEEFDEGTDPNNPDSDSDGIADGDEHHIFETDPLLSRTFRDGEYNDVDFVKGGYDIHTNTAYTPEQLSAIKAKVKEKGLHQPTLTTIGTISFDLYDFKDPDSTLLDELKVDQSPQAKLDRDTQRQTTIKKIGGALLKYKTDNKTFPAGTDFIFMSDAIQSFNTVATNYNDPINKDKYVYGYVASNSNLDFTLTYYSETQNQLIKYLAKDAEATAAKESSEVDNQQRAVDLDNIKSALMIYSSMQTSSQSEMLYVFPTKEQYPNVLLENRLLTTVPKDPNGSNYDYQVTATYESFTLKAPFQNPPNGVTGYMCNETECKNYK